MISLLVLLELEFNLHSSSIFLLNKVHIKLLALLLLRSLSTFILSLLGVVILEHKLSSQHYRNVSSRTAPHPHQVTHQDFAAFVNEGVISSLVLLELTSTRIYTLSFFSIKTTFNFWHCFCYRFRLLCPIH